MMFHANIVHSIVLFEMHEYVRDIISYINTYEESRASGEALLPVLKYDISVLPLLNWCRTLSRDGVLFASATQNKYHDRPRNS